MGLVGRRLDASGAEAARLDQAIDKTTAGLVGESETLAGVLPLLPQEGQYAVALEGKGRAAGTIFRARLRNDSPVPMPFAVNTGMVLVSQDERLQRMMIGRPASKEVPPGGEEEVDLFGYCLDPTRLPPPGEVEEATRTIWDDVDLTLKRSRTL